MSQLVFYKNCKITFGREGSSDKIFFFLIFFESNGIGGVWFANTHTENLPKLSHQYFSDSIKQ